MFRPDPKGIQYDRLISVLNDNTGLSKDNPPLWQLLLTLIGGVQQQEARFTTQIQQVIKAIQVDNNGNISARNLARTNTGDVRFASNNGLITVGAGNTQVLTVNNVNLITQVTEDGRAQYTPTLTNVTNLSASTPFDSTFMRIGNICWVFGAVDVDPTAAAATELGISLPIASNIGAETDCCGSGASHEVAGFSVGISGDTTNDRARMRWVAVDTSNRRVWYQFGYRVL